MSKRRKNDPRTTATFNYKPLWRYMSFAKFSSVLQKQAIFFSTLEILNDLTEGKTLSKSELTKEIENTVLSDRLPARKEKHAQLVTLLDFLEEKSKQFVCVTCWHENQSESRKMWQLYVPDGHGVAFISDVDRLGRSLELPDEATYCLGRVSYKRAGNGQLGGYFYKRKDYAHEKEVRAVIDLRSFHKDRRHPLIKQLAAHKGVFVPVQLRRMVSEIRLSPNSGKWFKELVQETLKNAGLSQIKVRDSEFG